MISGNIFSLLIGGAIFKGNTSHKSALFELYTRFDIYVDKVNMTSKETVFENNKFCFPLRRRKCWKDLKFKIADNSNPVSTKFI